MASYDYTVEYLSDEDVNLCLDCGVDMGPMNPRQLCGKWRCLNEGFIDLSDNENDNNYKSNVIIEEKENEEKYISYDDIETDEEDTQEATLNIQDKKSMDNAEYCEEPKTKKAKTNDE